MSAIWVISITIDDIQDVSSSAPDYIKDQEGETITSAVTLSLIRDTTDDYIFPSKGTKTNLSVTHAGGPLGGDANYTQYGSQSVCLSSLCLWMLFLEQKAESVIFKVMMEWSEKFPFPIDMFLGGINSLRGFRYVGPTNPGTTDVIGGTTMLVFNVEMVFPFIKDSGMKIVAFYDAGNSWNDGYDLDDLRQSVGSGIRWYSPIGPLRLEYGHIIDRGELNDDSTGAGNLPLECQCKQ